MMFSAVERGAEGWSGPVGIPAGDQSTPLRDSAWLSLDWYGRVISSGREDRHRLEASPRRRCADYADLGIVQRILSRVPSSEMPQICTPSMAPCLKFRCAKPLEETLEAYVF